MKVIKKDNEYDVTIIDGDKKLLFTFGGNLDLYWSIKGSNNLYEYFEITKENYNLYNLFEILFNDIKDINLYKDYPFYIETLEDLKDYKKAKEEEKNMYRLHNLSNYNELYNNDTITWYSDDDSYDEANILKISKISDSFRLEFYKKNNSFIPGISIRFRNSGSRYDPFNIVFMKMYNKLLEIDDTLDYGHQIHIEEYLYQKVKKI